MGPEQLPRRSQSKENPKVRRYLKRVVSKLRRKRGRLDPENASERTTRGWSW